LSWIRRIVRSGTSKSGLGLRPRWATSETTLRGQEFHQSRIVREDIEPPLFDVTTSNGRTSRDGYVFQNVVASYIHVHFTSNRSVVANLLRAAVSARQ